MCVPAAQQSNFKNSRVLKTKTNFGKIKRKKVLLLGISLNQHFQHWSGPVLVQRSPVLAQLYLTRVGGEEEHDGEARQQSSVLDGKGEEEAAAARVLFLTTHLIHLWKHVCQSDVQEHSPSQGKDPVGGEAVAGQDAKAHAQVTATSRQEVKEQSLLYTHSSVQQDHKVSQLVGKLLTQDGH